MCFEIAQKLNQIHLLRNSQKAPRPRSKYKINQTEYELDIQIDYTNDATDYFKIFICLLGIIFVLSLINIKEYLMALGSIFLFFGSLPIFYLLHFMYYRNQIFEWIIDRNLELLIYRKIKPHPEEPKFYSLGGGIAVVNKSEGGRGSPCIALVLQNNKKVILCSGNSDECRDIGIHISEFLGIPLLYGNKFKTDLIVSLYFFGHFMIISVFFAIISISDLWFSSIWIIISILTSVGFLIYYIRYCKGDKNENIAQRYTTTILKSFMDNSRSQYPEPKLTVQILQGLPESPHTQAITATHQKINNCIVCNMPLNENEELLKCPRCFSEAHTTHLLEWIKIKGYCPHCERSLKIKDFNEINYAII